MALEVEWIDHGREPKCPPDPNFPHGIDYDVSAGAKRTCETSVPYPAPRCGVYVVRCTECGNRYAFTVAGRPDDLRNVKLGCFLQKMNPNPPGSFTVTYDPTRKTASAPKGET